MDDEEAILKATAKRRQNDEQRETSEREVEENEARARLERTGAGRPDPLVRSRLLKKKCQSLQSYIRALGVSFLHSVALIASHNRSLGSKLSRYSSKSLLSTAIPY